MKKDRTCNYCNIVFENTEGRIFSNHVRWCVKNTTNGDKGAEANSKSTLNHYEIINGKKQEFEVNCFKCDKKIIVKEGNLVFPKKEKYYCSRACANSREHSEETKNKISSGLESAWKTGLFDDALITNKFVFTSKGEEEIRNYFIKNFPGDCWTFGGLLKHNNIRICRDLYSKKLKVCFEYDGIWHFKDIHGQLKRKQETDFQLEKWCIENEYRLIRIKEIVYISNKSFWLEKIKNEIYAGTDKIVKFY